MRNAPIGKSSLFAVFFLSVLLFSGIAAAGRVTVQNGQLNVTDSLGSSSLFVNSTSGKVGINISSPSATLHIVGAPGGSGGDSIYDVIDNGVTYRVHKFTVVGSSTFTAPSGVTSVECLIVAGGGGGASWYGGGGGAGGLIYNSSSFVTAGTSYPIVVGAGGAGRPATVAGFNTNDAFGSKGSNSSFNSQTAMGGGGAPGYNAGGRSDIEDGGSGAGGRPNNYDNLYSYGRGVSGQGNNGAIGDAATGGTRSGGGGGAGGAGVSGATTGAGGVGLSYSISGTPTYYAGGGGGGAGETAGLTTPGGLGGGGIGRSTVSGSNADANTGGGGGGSTALSPAGGGVGGNGGSGIVIIRYPLSSVVPAAVFQGNVGIGTSNPITNLHMTGRSFFNGSVGIGTSNPSAKLQVTSAGMDGFGGSVYSIVENGVTYRVHKFTTVGSSTFTAPSSGVSSVEVLVVAGGGGGGGYIDGGGGAGGLIYNSTYAVTAGQPIAVAVGAGGTGANGYNGVGTKGSNSTFGSLIAIGGGGGGGLESPEMNGGSGGGRGHGATGVGGSGTAGQGNNGGGHVYSGTNWPSGGGGGAGGAGGTPATGSSNAGNGGVGLAYSISGSLIYYAGGGAGGNYPAGAAAGTGGLGGGGNGGQVNGAGAPNTGGGGGGATIGNGGSGIVIVRYPIGTAAIFQGNVGIGTTTPSETLSVVGSFATNGSGAGATGGVITEFGGYRIHTFTGNGTFTPSGDMTVEVLVVAGGGGGGGTQTAYGGGGGGGAGGVVYAQGHSVTATSYAVTVGSGGAGGRPDTSETGRNGTNSSFDTIIAVGGGGGGYGGATLGAGQAGGSGGGVGYYGGTIGPAIQGNTGGTGYGHAGGSQAGNHGGGGGGAGTAGGTADGYGGHGGNGMSFDINGTSTYYGGGGGGGAYGWNNASTYNGGLGGGGVGVYNDDTTNPPINGTNGLGGGGGGRYGVGYPGGNGGSGVVIIRYPINPPSLYVASNGNVGIGTTNPSSSLQVVKASTGGTIGAKVTMPSAYGGAGAYAGIGVGQAPNSNGYGYITMGGSDSGNAYFYHQDAFTLAATGGMKLMLRAGAVDNGGITISGANVGIGTMSPSYTLTVAGTAWVTSGSWSGSDARWKRNVTSLLPSASLEKILALRPVNFEWNTTDFPNMGFTTGTQVGFIAQEVEKIIPEVVTTDDKGYKGMSYERIAPVIVSAVQEQQKEIDALKADKAAQQAQIAQLRVDNEQLKALVCADHPSADACK